MTTTKVYDVEVVRYDEMDIHVISSRGLGSITYHGYEIKDALKKFRKTMKLSNKKIKLSYFKGC